jgi:transcriptional regulator with XRE-family HTH domain
MIQEDTIKNNIKRLLKLRKVSVSELERKIEGKRSINNILRGSSKYPTIESIDKIARAFNVSIQELLYEHKDEQEYSEINKKLLLACLVETINILLDTKGKNKPSVDNLLFLAGQAYKHHQKLELDRIDKDFVNWVVNKYYS